MTLRQYDGRQLQACGEDVVISANVEIRRPQLVKVGRHVAIDSGFYCTVGADIGDYTHIGPYVTVIGGAEGRFTMGHFATISAGSRVICGSDEFLGHGLTSATVPKAWRDNVISAPVTLEMFASLATNVVVAPGVTIREGSVVGACSFVTESTEPWTIYFGAPAKAIKARPKERMREAARALGYL